MQFCEFGSAARNKACRGIPKRNQEGRPHRKVIPKRGSRRRAPVYTAADIFSNPDVTEVGLPSRINMQINVRTAVAYGTVRRNYAVCTQLYNAGYIALLSRCEPFTSI